MSGAKTTLRISGQKSLLNAKDPGHPWPNNILPFDRVYPTEDALRRRHSLFHCVFSGKLCTLSDVIMRMYPDLDRMLPSQVVITIR